MLQRNTAGRNRSGLVRGSGADRQRVDIGRHQLAHRGIDGPVPGQRRHARERLADDADIEMPAPVTCARMARVAVAVVAHLEHGRSGRRLQGVAARSEEHKYETPSLKGTSYYSFC